MELDDLKQRWKQTEKNKPSNTDIMELIQHKSYGPVAALKKAFKKQIRVMIIIPVIIFATNLANIDNVLTSIMFWSYVVFCIGIVAFSAFNYRIVSKMEGMDGVVKSNLEKQISILETRLKWNIIGVRMALLFFIVLIEVLPYFQHYRMLDKWHSLSPLIRYSTYAGFLALQYLLSRSVSQRKFGRHITYLKELVNEMQ